MFCCSSSFAAYLLQYVGRFVFEVKYMFFFFFLPKIKLGVSRVHDQDRIRYQLTLPDSILVAAARNYLNEEIRYHS